MNARNMKELIEHINWNKIRSNFILAEGLSRYFYYKEKEKDSEIISVQDDFITIARQRVGKKEIEIIPISKILMIVMGDM